MRSLGKFFLSSAQQKTFQWLINLSPSPHLAKNHFSRLLEICDAKTIGKLSAADFSALVRLLGSSSYLSDILFRQGKHCCEFFLRQSKIRRKPVSAHLADLETAMNHSQSLNDFCAALRRHKQREHLRIGALDLMASVTLEETVRELTALADASLEASYRFCRAEVELGKGKGVKSFVGKFVG